METINACNRIFKRYPNPSSPSPPVTNLRPLQDRADSLTARSRVLHRPVARRCIHEELLMGIVIIRRSGSTPKEKPVFFEELIKDDVTPNPIAGAHGST